MQTEPATIGQGKLQQFAYYDRGYSITKDNKIQYTVKINSIVWQDDSTVSIDANMKRQHSCVARSVKDILCVVTGREFNALNCNNNDELATIVFEDKEVENDGAIRLTLE